MRLSAASLALALGVAATSVFAQSALAQSAGTTVDGTVPAAPRGHFQPNAATSPTTADPQPSGVQAVDPASQVQKNLEGSNQRAVDSICADCLPGEKPKR